MTECCCIYEAQKLRGLRIVEKHRLLQNGSCLVVYQMVWFGLDSPVRWKEHKVSILLMQLLRDERGKINQKAAKPEL